MEKTALTLPTVHLNGTSRDELVRQNCDAAHALRVALDKLGVASPNGRDFYVNSDPDAFKKARAQHQARCEAVGRVIAEFEAIAEALIG